MEYHAPQECLGHPWRDSDGQPIAVIVSWGGSTGDVGNALAKNMSCAYVQTSLCNGGGKGVRPARVPASQGNKSLFVVMCVRSLEETSFVALTWRSVGVRGRYSEWGAKMIPVCGRFVS